MNGADEHAPWISGGSTDYRDDYIKAQLAQAVYYRKENLIKEGLYPREVPSGAMLPLGWSLLGDDQGNERNFRQFDSGFAAAAFEGPDGRIVISFRGSDEKKEWNLIPTEENPIGPNPILAADSDLLKELVVPVRTEKTATQLAAAQEWIAQKLGLPDWNAQFEQALDYVAEIRRQYPNRKIEVTGHSLGGAHAELASHAFGLDGRAFDPPGAGNLLDSGGYADYRRKHGIQRNDLAHALGLPIHQPDFINYLVKDSLISHKTGPHIFADRTVEISSLFGRKGPDEHIEWAIGKTGAAVSDMFDKLPPLIDKVAGTPVKAALRAEPVFKMMAESDTLNRHEIARIVDVFEEAARTHHLPTFGRSEPARAFDAPQRAPAMFDPVEPRRLSTGDPALDRLAAALSTDNDMALSHSLAHIAQSPQMHDAMQWGRDMLAAQQAEERQQAMAHQHAPGLAR